MGVVLGVKALQRLSQRRDLPVAVEFGLALVAEVLELEYLLGIREASRLDSRIQARLSLP